MSQIETFELGGSLCASCGDAPPVLEAAEQAFNAVAVLVQGWVARMAMPSGLAAAWGGHRRRRGRPLRQKVVGVSRPAHPRWPAGYSLARVEGHPVRRLSPKVMQQTLLIPLSPTAATLGSAAPTTQPVNYRVRQCHSWSPYRYLLFTKDGERSRNSIGTVRYMRMKEE